MGDVLRVSGITMQDADVLTDSLAEDENEVLLVHAETIGMAADAGMDLIRPWYKAEASEKANSDGNSVQAHGLWSDREHVLSAVSTSGLDLSKAAKHLRADREIVLAAVKENGAALRFASEDLQKDLDVVTVAALRHGVALLHASAALRKDADFMLSMVATNAAVLSYADDSLRQ